MLGQSEMQAPAEATTIKTSSLGPGVGGGQDNMKSYSLTHKLMKVSMHAHIKFCSMQVVRVNLEYHCMGALTAELSVATQSRHCRDTVATTVATQSRL